LALTLNPLILSHAVNIPEISFASRQILPFVVGADHQSMARL
jgi:hypothetical protein